MLTYKELIELKEKLTNQEISLENAKELFWKDFKEGKRAWHTKDWKERRDKIIKNQCEICGSIDTLTLQHLSHPKKYFEYQREVTNKYTNGIIETDYKIDISELTDYIIKKYDYRPTPLCPNCKNRILNIRVRKKPRFLCKECRHEFDNPIYKSAEELISTLEKNVWSIELQDKCFVSKDKWKNHYNLSQIVNWIQKELAKTNNNEKIEKEAFILYLDDNIRYLSFEDTITACQKCAFNFDKKNMELCPRCKENYKSVLYPTCFHCLPEEKRKEVLEYIEFEKEMEEMHKKLGIN